MDPKRNRIFLDSNVILSGFFASEGPPRLILDVLCLGLPVVCGLTGRFNILEIERNLEKQRPGALPVYREYLPLMNLEIIPLPARPDLRPYLGKVEEKDAPVLASAFNGRADLFVSGNRRLLAACRGMPDLRFRAADPGEFLDRILPAILAGPFRRP
jgi:predicted nucleic acid-binding protein